MFYNSSLLGYIFTRVTIGYTICPSSRRIYSVSLLKANKLRARKLMASMTMYTENFSFCVRNHYWYLFPKYSTGNTSRRVVGRASKKVKTVGILSRMCLYMLSVVS